MNDQPSDHQRVAIHRQHELFGWKNVEDYEQALKVVGPLGLEPRTDRL